MNDTTIQKLRRYAQRDAIDAIRKGPGGLEMAIAQPLHARNIKPRARRADIMLATMTEAELNDIRTILAVGRYAQLENGIGKYAPKNKEDLIAWRGYLGIKRLSQDESLKLLRKTSTTRILESLNSYINVQPSK